MKIKSIIPIKERENHKCSICGETRSVKYIVEASLCNRCAALNVLEVETEKSYVDLLSKLKADVKSDVIPNGERESILQTIELLEAMLWKYSY
jgi:hypothetical protein